MKLLSLFLAVSAGITPAFSEARLYQESSGLNAVFHKAQKRKENSFRAVAFKEFPGSLLASTFVYSSAKKSTEDASIPLPAREIIARYERAKFWGNAAGIVSGVASYIGTRAILRRLIGMEGGGIIGESVRLANIGVALTAGVAAGFVVRHYVKKHYLDKHLSS